MKHLSLIYVAGWLMVLAILGLVAFYVPPEEKVLGGSYLIFFYHFPSAFNCLLFFAFAGLASILHLATRSEEADWMSVAAVEVGVLGCTIGMVTGSIWAKAAWGEFWVWRDPRLLTVAIMWFTYLGYLALRSAIDTPIQRARYSAVFGIIAMVNLPLVWFSIRLFGSVQHPMKISVDPRMRITMWAGALAFLVLFIGFWIHRYRIARLRDEAFRIEEDFARREI
jgi:heme exporter protein C